MFALMKMAWRNVFAHKLKTLIVGGLIFLGIFLLVLGNAFLESTNRSIQKSYSQSVTGEIAILKQIDFDYSLFGTWNDMGNLSVPVLPDMVNTRSYLEEQPGVRAVTPVSSSFMMVNTGESNPDFWIMGMAVDPASYRDFFNTEDTLILHEGRFLEPGEEGIVLSRYTADYLKDYKGLDLHPGDKILLNGFSSKGFRIREIPIRGIYEYRYVKGDMYPMLPRTCFIDQQNANLLNGVVLRQEDESLPEELEDPQLLFSMDDLFSETVVEGSAVEARSLELEDIVGDLSLRHQLSKTDDSQWQWLLISMENKNDKDVEAYREELESYYQDRFSRFIPEDIGKPGDIAVSLLDPSSKDQEYLASLLTEDQRRRLEHPLEQDDTLVEFFNSLLSREDLYQAESFEGVYFSSITRNLLEDRQKDYQLIRRNRLLLEETYPYALIPGPDYMVSLWWHVAAPMSSTVMSIQWVMNFSLSILFIVAIIIIMNTLIISVMERTGEIGTIRAMGGRKSFIFGLFTAETMTISFIFGMLGLLAGALAIGILGWKGIPATEGSMMQLIAGGNTLYPALSPWIAGFSVIFMLLVGLLSSIYPVLHALKISPVEAMRQD